MKKIFSLIFAFFTTVIFITAQPLTKKEAINFAKELYKIEILSEKGKDDLIRRIRRKELKRLFTPNIYNKAKVYSYELSHAQILNYCHEAFYNETAFRLGLTEYNKLATNIYEKKHTYYLKPQQRKVLDSVFNANRDNYKGVEVERQIHKPPYLGVNYNLKYPYKLSYLDGEYELIHKSRSALGQSTTETIEDLISINLFDTSLYEVKEIAWGIEYNSLLFASIAASHYEDKAINRLKSTEFLEGLYQTNIFTKNKFEQLMDLENEGKIKDKTEIYKYFENGVLIEIDYQLTIDSFYQNLFQTFQSIIPNFDYQDLKIKRKKINNSTYFNLQFSINGMNYISENIQHLSNQSSKVIINNLFLKGVQQYLRDINSNKRLYYSKPFLQDFSDDYNYLGFALLTQNQAKKIDESMVLNHDNKFTTQYIEETVQLYKTIGLFDHLTEEMIKYGVDKIVHQMIYNHIDILSAFPNAYYYSQWELENYQNPCEEVIEYFATVSQDFTPIYIQDTWGKYFHEEAYDSIYCSFQFNGRVYRKGKLSEYALGDEMIQLIRKAIKDKHIDGDIYSISGDISVDDDGIIYIFLTNEQYRILYNKQSELFKFSY